MAVYAKGPTYTAMQDTYYTKDNCVVYAEPTYTSTVPVNALSPILITDFGNVTSVIPVQPENADSGIASIPERISRVLIPVQPIKALSSELLVDVTLPDRLTEMGEGAFDSCSKPAVPVSIHRAVCPRNAVRRSCRGRGTCRRSLRPFRLP